MTHALVTCPVGPLGRTECAQMLIDRSAEFGSEIHVSTLPPLVRGPYETAGDEHRGWAATPPAHQRSQHGGGGVSDGVFLNFTKRCETCGETVTYENGQREPHPCPQGSAVVIDGPCGWDIRELLGDQDGTP